MFRSWICFIMRIMSSHIRNDINSFEKGEQTNNMANCCWWAVKMTENDRNTMISGVEIRILVVVMQIVTYNLPPSPPPPPPPHIDIDAVGPTPSILKQVALSTLLTLDQPNANYFMCLLHPICGSTPVEWAILGYAKQKSRSQAKKASRCLFACTRSRGHCLRT